MIKSLLQQSRQEMTVAQTRMMVMAMERRVDMIET